MRLPDGYSLQRPTLAEVPEILALVHASDVAAVGFPDFDESEVTAALTGTEQPPDPVPGYTIRPLRTEELRACHELVCATFAETAHPLPGHRGRGLASALLRAAFAGYTAEGRSKVGLGVDTTNPTGVYRLYESLGMTLAYRVNVYRQVITV
ncbi:MULTISPECIES: N-acetyltransferase [unclassified Crossiella]|uniref:GNAT family N-acetyltransferase n=1 Tax=unclassified Crossiella TaxID=2620835 RepID=UPI001FFEFAD4|nr:MULTISPECIES: GNAT family N-acetyltransferase [unclassified Crossiella]MCK2238863.1 hypothetical protein [Crossiella sp. S99.2]MCK2251567.1 hypothetical protein [Crossiella sp. S99.1]